MAEAGLPDPDQDAETQRMLHPQTFRWKATDLPDFHDVETRDFTPSKPAYKMLEEAVKESYYKVSRNASLNRNEVDKGSFDVPRRIRNLSPEVTRRFHILNDTSDYAPSSERLFSSTFRHSNPYSTDSNTRKYAAPRQITFGSDEDVSATTCNFPQSRYYSRRTYGDPDYYDYDLMSAVENCKMEQKTYRPRPTDYKDTKRITELSRTKGAEPVAGNIWQKRTGDWRDDSSNLLSCALRTPGFWTKRFENLVSDSNHLESTYTTNAASSSTRSRQWSHERSLERERSLTPLSLSDTADD